MNSLGLQTYVELFHFPSLAQSNVFNLTYMQSDNARRLKNSSKTYDILVAFFRPVSDPLASKYCFTIHHFDIEDNIIQPVTKTIDFAYLPGASDIVCINSLHDEITDEYFVAIGFVKEGEKGYLNIYRSKSEEKLPEDCLSYSKLLCAPLHLTHAHCLIKDELQWAFFLSFGEPFSEISSQNKPSENQPGVKIFSKLIDTNIFYQVESDQNTGSSGLSQPQTCHSNPEYGELPFDVAVILFPELKKLPTTSIFLHMDFKIINNVRLSSFGSQDGWFGFFAVDMKSLGIIRHFNLSHESPITSIKIFQRVNVVNLTSQEIIKDNDEESVIKKDVNCLVCSAFEPAVVYCNIFKNNGFSIQNQLILPFSTDFDHVNCASVDDFNLDGKCEIILGTFGQRLLYYEWELNSRTESTNGQFILKAQRSLPGPVFCISPALDLIGEGPLSLAVVTSRGLHIFQHDTYCLVKEIHHRLNTRSFTLNT
uniref:Kaptin n=1 Tax=Schistosoma japonicum TaxID=6182 RepID=C1L4P4_SCHJA|nr:Kaptin [Schistosoma japonicum]